MQHHVATTMTAIKKKNVSTEHPAQPAVDTTKKKKKKTKKMKMILPCQYCRKEIDVIVTAKMKKKTTTKKKRIE